MADRLYDESQIPNAEIQRFKNDSRIDDDPQKRIDAYNSFMEGGYAVEGEEIESIEGVGGKNTYNTQKQVNTKEQKDRGVPPMLRRPTNGSPLTSRRPNSFNKKGDMSKGIKNNSPGFPDTAWGEKMKIFSGKDPSLPNFIKEGVRNSGRDKQAIDRGEIPPELAADNMANWMDGYAKDQRQKRFDFRNSANNPDVPESSDPDLAPQAKPSDPGFGSMFESRNLSALPEFNTSTEAGPEGMNTDVLGYLDEKSGELLRGIQRGINFIPGGEYVSSIPGKAFDYAMEEGVKPVVKNVTTKVIQADRTRMRNRGEDPDAALKTNEPSEEVKQNSQKTNKVKSAKGDILSTEAQNQAEAIPEVEANAENGVQDVVVPSKEITNLAKWGEEETPSNPMNMFDEGIMNDAANWAKEMDVEFKGGQSESDLDGSDEEDWYEDPDFYASVGHFMMALVVTGGNMLAAYEYASGKYDGSKAQSKRQDLAPSLRQRGKTEESIMKYIQSGDPEDLENMSAEQKEQATADKARFGALQESYKVDSMFATSALDQGRMDFRGDTADVKSQELANDKSLRDKAVREKTWTEDQEAWYNRKLAMANLNKINADAAARVRGTKLDKGKQLKQLNDQLNYLKKLYDSGAEGRKNVTQLLFGVAAEEAGFSLDAWRKSVGNGMRVTVKDENGKVVLDANGNPAEVNSWQEYPLSGMHGDAYNTTEEAGMVRAVWDNVLTANDSSASMYDLQKSFDKGIKGSDLSDKQKVTMKRAYAQEMAFITAVAGDKTRLNKHEYLRLRNKFFAGTGDTPNMIAQQVVKRRQAIALRVDAAGKQVLGTVLDDESINRTTDFYRGLDVKDARIDRNGNQLVKLSKKGASHLNKRLGEGDGSSTVANDQWINIDEHLEEYIYAGRDAEMLNKQNTKKALDRTQKMITDLSTSNLNNQSGG